MENNEGMSPAKIAIIVAVVIVIIAVIVIIYRIHQSKSKTEPMLISKPTSSTSITPIKGIKAPLSITGREYTYNFWINIRSWASSTEPKCVLYRSSTGPEAVAPNGGIANPSIWLYPNENKMMVRVSTVKGDTDYDPNTYAKTPYSKSSDDSTQYTAVNPASLMSENEDDKSAWLQTSYACDIDNIPLQRWVQVSVIMWNRTLDVYINGKLVRSCILPGIPVHEQDELQTIYVGSNKTFNGYISRLKYYNRAITAKDVMNLYEKGPLPVNWWWQALKNRIKVTLDINND
jgi:hypothetical protein